MNRHYESELPSSYEEVYTVDAKDRKTVIVMNLAALLLLAAAVVIGWLLIRPDHFFANYSLVRNLVFLVSMGAYIVLHELVHGAAYKLLTGQKLSFGFTGTAAFCGVPDIYVYRTASLIAVLAPFCVFTIVFLAFSLLAANPWDRFYAVILLGLHIGGCSGDLFNAGLYLFRFRDPGTLTRDMGPKQSFYQPRA